MTDTSSGRRNSLASSVTFFEQVWLNKPVRDIAQHEVYFAIKAIFAQGMGGKCGCANLLNSRVIRGNQ